MRRALPAILLPVVMLLGMEACARVIITLREDARASRAAPPVLPETVASPELGWERLPNFQGRLAYDFGRPVRKYDERGFQSYDTLQVADQQTPRIVAIGDSNTYGWGVPPESAFAEVLDRALPHAGVINLGMLGYSSFQGYRALVKYGEELKPAAIIASFNYNDRRYVLNRNIDGEGKFTRYADGMNRARAYRLVNRIYLARLMSGVMRKAGLIKEEPVLAMDVRNLEARVPPDSYRDNLRKIAEYGRARSIPVIFLLLRDNPAYTSQLTAGIEYHRNGQDKSAVRSLTRALANTITGTLARKYLVQTYEKLGATEDAAAAAHVDGFESMDGATPIYLDTDYNTIMTEVAGEFHVTLVDARPLQQAHPEWFIDMCHPDEAGHAEIAGLLLEAVRQVAPDLAAPLTSRRSDVRLPL